MDAVLSIAKAFAKIFVAELCLVTLQILNDIFRAAFLLYLSQCSLFMPVSFLSSQANYKFSH